jgi:hypothetical protein
MPEGDHVRCCCDRVGWRQEEERWDAREPGHWNRLRIGTFSLSYDEDAEPADAALLRYRHQEIA